MAQPLLHIQAALRETIIRRLRTPGNVQLELLRYAPQGMWPGMLN